MSSENTAPHASPQYPENALFIDSLDMEAQGVAHREGGKVVFVEGALATEVVTATISRRKNNWEKASLNNILRESSQRVTPHCPHFGLHQEACGGCKMQHLSVAGQLAVKQRVLEDNLWHLGKVKTERVMRPIQGPDWGYRWRARLSVRYVRKKETVLVGFHERKSRYIADMKVCRILPPHIDDLLLPLRALIASMEAKETCPQIEVACGDEVTALVLRHLEPLSTGDLALLRAFAQAHPFVQWWLQPKGPDTVHRLEDGGNKAELAYTLPEFGIRMPFKPTDFTQVNPHINRVLVGRALQLLQVQRNERVIDWFCGLGNFSLPLATQSREVLGIEGSDTLVGRASDNWQANQHERQAQALALPPLAPTTFVARNLFNMTPELLQADGVAEKWLIDPPREGAHALSKALAHILQQRMGYPGQSDLAVADAEAASDETAQNQHAESALEPFHDDPHWMPPQRIVYVSCAPATLARDAGLLVHHAGYRCTAAGVVNMFPHTAHVESIAVFERTDAWNTKP
ncbi:23S rRNA (uracil(1939)-C(5))-methyltransferase RlmD [Lampropedia aestuarii]|uniref:23S rRNA (uracil(1939)-C(5))-methyltransferase RlmD n=1 Tax=Lampropedia aestuarii TaxID=2562762 RepID=A0A4S5BYI5_9BURK|nr:23S rRNA (uracil(1939)-C(5))-methyltransferase RlmD [Lampropedia aestuarii]THJ36145.1 23S rRNA (uracil(1939)-C(5))-methyltransferase RlmD [Lampropedia aestuarii]